VADMAVGAGVMVAVIGATAVMAVAMVVEVEVGDTDASANLSGIKAAQRDYQMRRMDALSMIDDGGTPWLFDVKQPIIVIRVDEALGRI